MTQATVPLPFNLTHADIQPIADALGLYESPWAAEIIARALSLGFELTIVDPVFDEAFVMVRGLK